MNSEVCDVEEGKQNYGEEARKSYKSVDAKYAKVEEEDGEFDEVDHDGIDDRRGRK